jgi:hypothetical protein
MKSPRIISTAILSLLLGVAAPALAGQDRPADQQDHAGQNTRHQDKSRQQDHQQKPSADTQRQQGDQEQRDRRTYQQSRRDEQGRQAQRQPDRQPQQMQRQVPEQQRQARDSQDRQVQPERDNRGHDRGYDRGPSRQGDRQSAWEQHRANNWQSDHRTWQQRGGYDGYRVPQNRYRGYFGPQHGFRIGGLPFMTVGGYPRFQYSGYWISLVDPWPGEWGNDWYDSDDMYIGYVDNGYYLFNSRYPGMGIAISISR